MSDLMKTSLNFMLIGKTGVGKSATGNTLLDRSVFATSQSFKSCTQIAVKESNEYKQFIFSVVDTPGLFDTKKDVGEILKSILEGISLVPEGIHAFLLVLKFGERCTQEMNETIKVFTDLFGESTFQQFCIIALTHGDLCQELNNDNVVEWCKNKDNIGEGSELDKLMTTCGYKVVLFNNKDEAKREKSVQKVLSCIPPKYACYTHSKICTCADARDASVTSRGFPAQRANIQKQLSLLEARIDNLQNNNGPTDVDDFLLKADDLLRTIETESRGTHLMDDLKRQVYAMKNKIKNLPKGGQERIVAIQEVKKSINWWKISGGASCTFAAVSGAGLGIEGTCSALGLMTLLPGIGWALGISAVTVGLVSYAIYALTKDPDSAKDEKRMKKKPLKKTQ